jgi:hypothetical protein
VVTSPASDGGSDGGAAYVGYGATSQGLRVSTNSSPNSVSGDDVSVTSPFGTHTYTHTHAHARAHTETFTKKHAHM